MLQTSEMVSMSQTPKLLLNMMYHAFALGSVCAGGEGQPYLNHKFSCIRMAFE